MNVAGSACSGKLLEVLRSFCSDRAYRHEMLMHPEGIMAQLSERDACCLADVLRQYAEAERSLSLKMRYPLTTSVEAYLVARR